MDTKMEAAKLYGIAKLNYSELRPNQRKVIEGYASGKDVFNWQREIINIWISSFWIEFFFFFFFFLKIKHHCLGCVVLLCPAYVDNENSRY